MRRADHCRPQRKTFKSRLWEWAAGLL